MERGFDILNWDGTISSTEFRIAAFAFAEKWQRFNSTRLPQWSWTLCPKHRWTAGQEAEGYLCLENVFLHGSSKEDDEISDVGKEEPGCSGQDEAIDGAILVQSCGDEIHCYDFHIVYSSSYRVPVLYFRGYCSDGQPLALDEIQKDLPGNSSKLLTESKWTFITQEEHPFLNRPWCNLHPCGTSEWMKLLLSIDACQAQHGVASENYLVSWLSVVGQVVGLRIPFEMLNGSGCLPDEHPSQ